MCVCVCVCLLLFHKLLYSPILRVNVHCNVSLIAQNETLIRFIQDGNISNAKRLFETSFSAIDLRARDVRTGKTALILAAERNLTEIMGMMLQHPTFDPTLTDVVSRVHSNTIL